MGKCGGKCGCDSKEIAASGEGVEKPLEMLLLEIEAGTLVQKNEELCELLRSFDSTNILLQERLEEALEESSLLEAGLSDANHEVAALREELKQANNHRDHAQEQLRAVTDQLIDCKDQVKAIQTFVSRLLGGLSEASDLRAMILKIDPGIKKKDLRKVVVKLMEKATGYNFTVEQKSAK